MRVQDRPDRTTRERIPMNTTPVPTIIERDGHPEYAVLPWAEYQALLAAAAEGGEDATDRAALAAVDADPAEEYLPAAMVDRLLAGDSPLRLWRRHRGLKIRELAAATKTSESYLSQIETGKRAGSLKAMGAYAAALRVTIDDIAAKGGENADDTALRAPRQKMTARKKAGETLRRKPVRRRTKRAVTSRKRLTSPTRN
jgi:transcriptional regulator with XRE-family HTH domain